MHLFLKGGIYNKLDRPEDHSVNIGGLEDYELPAPEKEFYLQSDEESMVTVQEVSYNEGNENGNSSSENSSADLSLKDCSNLADYLIIFSCHLYFSSLHSFLVHRLTQG